MRESGPTRCNFQVCPLQEFPALAFISKRGHFLRVQGISSAGSGAPLEIRRTEGSLLSVPSEMITGGSLSVFHGLIPCFSSIFHHWHTVLWTNPVT